ncbi:MAG TPA: hypothetical protein VG406_18365 [Isosphaeraceae bacterium]|jgi:hypothetical protein|nr:hypothetical protein [Isosphaeraceae bacterium]
MAATRRKRTMPNPFYVALLVVSTAFVVTALAYLMGPFLAERELAHPEVARRAGSRALADWFDRRGPLALGVESALMVVTAVLAMASDRWFAPKARRPGPTPPDPNP